MRKTLKRVLSTTLATLMVASVASVASVATYACEDIKLHTFEEACEEQWYEELGEIETTRYLFYMPDSWKTEHNARYDGSDPSTYSAGIYWWDTVAVPEFFRWNSNKWPGYAVLERDPDCSNVYIAEIPSEVPQIVWNNSVDGGEDSEAAIYTEAIQSDDASVCGYDPGLDTYGFYPDGLASMADMIYVINPDDVSVTYQGKETYMGEWFYYYGNGEYGIAPTKEEAGDNVYSNGEFPAEGLIPSIASVPNLGVGAEQVVTFNKENTIATSENAAIAKVTRTSNGRFVVTGVKEGTTNILFESENEVTKETNTFKLPVTVIKTYFDRNTITLNVGESNYVFGIGLGANAKITYSKKGIVTYDPVTNMVVAKKAGTTKVTATQGGKSISFTATVKAPKLNKTTLKLAAGKTSTLKVSNAKGAPVFTSSNTKVATVDKKTGKVTALKKGNVTITAKVDGKKLTCKVNVTSNPKLAKKTVTVKVKKTTTVKVTGAVSKASIKVSKAKNANVTVAKDKLTIKGVKKGNAKVTVTINGVSNKLTIKVKK